MRANERDLRLNLEPMLDRPSCILKGTDSWWLGGETGLFRIELVPESGPVILARALDQHLAGNVCCLRESGGVIWAGVLGKSLKDIDGLFRVDTKPPQLQLLNDTALGVRSLHASRDALWIGTPAGLYRLASPEAIPKRILTKGRVHSLHPNGEGVFVGTQYGVYRCLDEQSGSSPPIASTPKPIYGAYSTGPDLWFGRQDGIYCFSANHQSRLMLASAEVGDLKDSLQFLKAGATLWIATEKGLFNWREGWARPKPVNLPIGAVKSLTRSPENGPIWAVGSGGIFRIAGADSPNWSAQITFDGLRQERFTDETISVKWAIGNYGWQTTPEIVHCRVRVLGADGSPVMRYPPDSEWLPTGTWEIPVEPLREGTYTVEVEAEDLHGHIAQTQSGPITVRKRPPILWWLYALFAGIVSLAGGAWAMSHPGILRRFYEWRGAAHILRGGGCKNRLEVSVEGGQYVLSVKEKSGGKADIDRVKFVEGPGANPPFRLLSGQPALALPESSDWELEIPFDSDPVDKTDGPDSLDKNFPLTHTPIGWQFDTPARPAETTAVSIALGSQWQAGVVADVPVEAATISLTLPPVGWQLGPPARPAEATAVSISSSHSWPAGLPTNTPPPGATARISIPFSYPWCKDAIRRRLAEGANAVVVGQRRVKPPLPHDKLKLTEKERRQRRLTVAGLCHGMLAAHIVDEVQRQAKRLAVVPMLFRRTGATVNDLVQAIQTADVVYVAAHANPKGILLCDPRGGEVRFGAEHVERLDASARCRLLLLASCSVGAGGGLDSLLYGLQMRGINVVASTIDTNIGVATRFMRDVLKEFLTERREKDGNKLAHCMRTAAGNCLAANADEEVKKNLDSIVLYGDPMLYISRT